MLEHTGPQIAACDRVHAEKHRLPGESFAAATNRVAAALKDDDRHYHEFRDITGNMRFMPAGRIQAAMGASKQVTAYNCFVSGDIEDSFVDGPGSIMDRAKEAATTMRMGGGIGYNFSTLRPAGSPIKKLGSTSAGPVPFIRIFDAVGRATSSSGHRRGAELGTLNIHHPDIVEFILAKNNQDQLTGFNLSVGITDDFMEALYTQKPYALHWGGKTFAMVDPVELWETIMKSTWDWADPGILFLDTINRMNPLYYCETLSTTNPCGEQPLPPFGACLLGSFNLTKYMYRSLSGKWEFDYSQLIEDIPHVVRAMDNVVDRTIYPLVQHYHEARNKRRMGLGITGLANAAEALGFPYGSPEFLHFQTQVMSTIRDGAYSASALLAREKGSFPLYLAEKYQKGQFFQTLSEETQELIKRFGLRNSHLLSVAPTGTMSFTMDNVSSGIEPVFAYSQERDILDAHGRRTEIIEDYGKRVFGIEGKRTSDVTIDEHLNVLATATKHVDSAVSKTCNVSPNMPWEDFKQVYVRAHQMGCKGITTFNTGGKKFGILRSNDVEPEVEANACTWDPVSGQRECS